jgi:hypothetical protein
MIKLGLWLLVMLGFTLGIALAMPIGNPTGTAAAAAVTAVALGAAISVARNVDTSRKRARSTKNDARSRSGLRPTHPQFPSLRVRVLLDGKLERVPTVAAADAAATDDDAEEPTQSGGKNTLNISAAHHYAYFNPGEATTFTEDQRAAMNATQEVMQATTTAAQESNLGKHSGISYWKKISNWMRFENWVVM